MVQRVFSRGCGPMSYNSLIRFLACSLPDNSYSFDPTKLKLCRELDYYVKWRILFGGYTPIIFSRVIVRCASCVMHRLSTLENKYSNIFIYKTIAHTVLKFYMEHDLAPGSQNYKIGSARISKMAAITKNNKINFFSRTTGYFWLNFGMEYQ